MRSASGASEEQRHQLDRVHFYGNNGWARNSQSEVMLPAVLRECAVAGLAIDDVVEAMRQRGHDEYELRQLRRWENKRLTGKFGK